MARISFLDEKLIRLTKNFSFKQYVKCRIERNWEKFDMLDITQKMHYRIKELNEYLYGNSSKDEEIEEY